MSIFGYTREPTKLEMKEYIKQLENANEYLQKRLNEKPENPQYERMERLRTQQEIANLKKNSIPISHIEKKIEELKNVLDIIKTGKDDFSKGQASVLERIIKMFDKELLDERNNTDEH